ncbi:MAG: hypothetical protein A2Z91_04570 [Deltaproteobacteria bacterium GWA2_38_16]|nr:MAG: hypothetical protein A2Z91_04570 [Deltaproteobacteria bacterium GWA2_38_16]OGQ01723.1 MAG: hypothetical protein A3D19_07610 [Deltaproteobacteria bacterium RIFCSPHIGHO2_02_FULL_38_15]OGQ61386.1 MAG: hypothetical protein A3G92_04680 [Deltaproteobacteria bacterium RIFCSPLOWO2_12_FULL_38_8]HBQ21475.1 hypothetical protein [Deltaproteobacteria bacterium]
MYTIYRYLKNIAKLFYISPWVLSPKDNLHRPSSLRSGRGGWSLSFGATQPNNTFIYPIRWSSITINSFIIIFCLASTSCSFLKPRPTTDDPLLDFYSTEPAAHTRASLRLTEKARTQISPTTYTTAIDTLNKALTIDPQNPFAYYFLAWIYYEKDDYKKSNGFLEKAKQLFSPFPFWKAKSYELSSLNWEKLGDKKRAHAQLKKAKEIYPNL